MDLSNYDLIYIGTPTWANNAAPAIITIIDRCNWAGKDVILFTTTSSSDGESTLDRMEEKVGMRGGRVIKSFHLQTKDKSPEDIITDTESLIQMLDLKMYGGI